MSTRVRNVLGCASFLTVLRTHRISRSLPLPPQRIPASPAVVPAAAGPSPHAHPATSKCPRNRKPHAHAACCTLHRVRVAGILWKSLAVGRAVASAQSTDAGRRRSTGAMDATPCAEHFAQNRSAQEDAPRLSTAPPYLEAEPRRRTVARLLTSVVMCRRPSRPHPTPALLCAPKQSRWNDQRPRSWPLRLGAASSHRRARSQSAAEPDAPHTISDPSE